MMVYKRRWLLVLVFVIQQSFSIQAQDVGIWQRFEKEFTSANDYGNPIYDVRFNVQFTSPTGRVKNIMGFWDGSRSWKVRFMPDEKGTWQWKTVCSDEANKGLNELSGSFNCTENSSQLNIYKKGAITRTPGLYHLEYSDGAPFFWAGCTAWNGTLKSTDAEWKHYLENRVDNHYSIIQFVTTQWRGGDKNSNGQVAFEGSGLIRINPDFFQHLDKKIDQINDHGLVAAPVLLWALPVSTGRHLSPGYYLPEDEAILLARYMVARYGGHHVVWILGGDGKYVDNYEQRWKNIGRGVFGDQHPGLVAQHPGGRSWIGEVYAEEEWLDIVGYQSGHNNSPATASWITKGPIAKGWNELPPKPFINMEPVYEEIHPEIKPVDIRNASYWSLFSVPVSGITYGANGIWPWLRESEVILNHAGLGENTSRWRESLALPGSVQVGYLSAFMQTLEWWKLKPAPSRLLEQPGINEPKKYISVSQSDDKNTILVYMPSPGDVAIYNEQGNKFEGAWFDPVRNKMSKAKIAYQEGLLNVSTPSGTDDRILVLKKTR